MLTTDVVIIGAGVYGSALAYELTRARLTVTVLERNEVASGASGGIGYRGVRSTNRDVRELPLMRSAYDIWPLLTSMLGEDPGFRRIGGLFLLDGNSSNNPVAMAEINTMVETQNRYGIPTDIIGINRVRELEPEVAGTVTGAVYTPLDGIVDHTAATRAYASAAARAGADIHEHVTVVRVEIPSDGGAIAIADSGKRYRATRAIVVLMNSYTPTLLSQSFGLNNLPLWRFNPQMTSIRPHGEHTLNCLINHYTRIFSAKAVKNNLVMLSGGRSGVWDTASDQGTPDPRIPIAAVADAGALFPSLAGSDVVVTDASRPESVCLDKVPIIDQVPGQSSVYFATGWSGHGFAIAPAVARSLSNWICTGTQAPELRAFALDRFSTLPQAVL